MDEESNITILNGVDPPKKPCPERMVGKYENNSSALGCIRKATSDTVVGVLSFFKYAEFGFFELQREGETERDSSDDETYSACEDQENEENKEEGSSIQESWKQDSYHIIRKMISNHC